MRKYRAKIGYSGYGTSMKQRISFPAGKIIFRQAYPSDYAYVIVSGKVEIYRELDDGKEERIALLGEGDMFGEYGLLDEAPRSASARVLEDVKLDVMDL